MILYNPFRKLQQTLIILLHSHADMGRRLRQVADYRRLYERKGLFADEYLEYDFDMRSEDFRRSFLGLNEQRYYLDLLNPTKFYILARNKYLAHKMLANVGVRKAELYACYMPEGRFVENDEVAHDVPGVARLLQQKGVQQCVIKAAEGSHGDAVSVAKMVEYIDEDCLFHLYDGTQKRLSELLDDQTLLFESLIRQTDQMASLNATSVNTIRFMTALYPDGTARLVATFIKIGRASSCVDNAGAGGNVDACVDTRTGVLTYAIRYDGEHNYQDIESHPDSGTQINGLRIENWDAIKAEVLRFQQAFPYLKAAGWDIAITDEGPVVVEVNDMWDRLGQLFLRRGWRPEIRDCFLAWQHQGKQYHFGRLKQKLRPSHIRKIVRYE